MGITHGYDFVAATDPAILHQDVDCVVRPHHEMSVIARHGTLQIACCPNQFVGNCFGTVSLGYGTSRCRDR